MVLESILGGNEMQLIVYKSKTKKFNSSLLKIIQDLPPEKLMRSFGNSPPLLILRAVAEVLLNNDNQKLELLLKDEELTNSWRKFSTDFSVNTKDYEYAEKLEAKRLEFGILD